MVIVMTSRIGTTWRRYTSVMGNDATPPQRSDRHDVMTSRCNITGHVLFLERCLWSWNFPWRHVTRRRRVAKQAEQRYDIASPRNGRQKCFTADKKYLTADTKCFPFRTADKWCFTADQKCSTVEKSVLWQTKRFSRQTVLHIHSPHSAACIQCVRTLQAFKSQSIEACFPTVWFLPNVYTTNS